MTLDNSDQEIIFTEIILNKLSAMHGVCVEEKNGSRIISKDGFKFGEIENSQLKLLNKNGNYMIVDKSVLSDNDLLLLEATSSYWIAAGKK